MEYKKLDFKNAEELDLLVELQKAVYPERADAFDKSNETSSRNHHTRRVG